jgi:hypothetical protein
MNEEVGNCVTCNSWDDSLEEGICQTCINEEPTEQVSWTVLIDLATQLAELSVTNEKGEEIVRTNVSAG